MKMKIGVKFVILFTICPIITFGQKIPTSKKIVSDKTISIDVYDAYKNRKDYSLSSIAESIEYIPLETGPDCLLGDFSNAILTSTDIFIYVYENICYHFNRQGKFINTIGSVGKGPGECLRSRNIAVDSVNNWVYILDYDKILKFDYSGKFIKSFKPKEGALSGSQILMVKPNLYLIGNVGYGYSEPEQRFSFSFFSDLQNGYISHIKCEKKDKIPFCVDLPSMYNYNQESFIKDFWSDTIYRVKNPYELVAYATLNLGKFKYREVEDKSILSGKKNNGEEWILDVKRAAESERFIIIVTNKGVFIYDKKEKLTTCANFMKQQNNRWTNFLNDISSYPIKSLGQYHLSINNNALITYNDAYEFFESEYNQNKLQGKLTNLSPDDNPVLVIIKLKE